MNGPQGPELANYSTEKDLLRDRLADLGDCDLVRHTLEGENLAFEALMKRHSPMLMGFLAGKTSNACDAEDLAQEVFISCYRYLSKLREQERFAPWLMRIARNRLTDYYRTKGRRPQLFSAEFPSDDDQPSPGLERFADSAPGPDERMNESQTRQIIFQEIEKLPETYRTLLYLRLLGEESIAEIASRLNLKVATVRMRLYRGLKKLREALKRQGLEPPGFSSEKPKSDRGTEK